MLEIICLFFVSILFDYQTTVYAAQGNVSDYDVLLNQLIWQCPIITSFQRPTLDVSEPIVGSTSLGLYKFLEIDDTEERISMMLEFDVSWQLPQCATWNLADWNGIDEIVVEKSNSNRTIWAPSVANKNNVKDQFVIDALIKQFNSIRINNTGVATATAYGKFDTSCNLADNLFKFPFDTQNCTLEFFSWVLTTKVKLSNAGFVALSSGSDWTQYPLREFLDESSTWELIGLDYWSFDWYGNYSDMCYSLLLRRKPQFFIYNIIFPCLCLCLLQWASFGIPAKYPERPIFSLTVLLAFYFLQIDMKSMIPDTSNTLLIVIFITGQSTIGVLITIYAAIAAHLVGGVKKDHHDEIVRVKVRYIEIADLCMFIAIVVGSITFNVVIISLMISG